MIHDPSLNRGTCFSPSERERLSLRGLVPPRQQALSQQLSRVKHTYDLQVSNLDKYVFLSMLMDRNTILFYRLLVDNFRQLAPIIYTPVVGLACQNFHSIYRRARGMYFSVEDRPHFPSMVYNWPVDHVDVIVVTDGSRVLALGDLGCNAMNIPIGKLSLYVAAGGLHPDRTLPVVLDVGTDNEQLRNDALYLGLNRPRLRGQQYFDVVDDWLSAIRTRWPNALVQFEDFGSDVAAPLLNQHVVKNAPCFNDDIQSTGCIAVAAVLASLRARGKDMSHLKGERIICAGAGSAGVGVCDSIVRAMMCEGVSQSEARNAFYMLDHNGLLGKGTTCSNITNQHFVRPDLPHGMSLEDVIKHVKPTVLLGLSGVGCLFTERIIRQMSTHVEKPVVFPMSNPSTNSECTPEQAFTWSDGRAIFASGSPFDNVTLSDGGVGISNQANNVYSFPGLGLAVSCLRISRVTDDMFLAAARRIARMCSEEELSKGVLFPPIEELRNVSVQVAVAVAQVAFEQGLVKREGCTFENEMQLKQFLEAEMWDPQYDHIVAED